MKSKQETPTITIVKRSIFVLISTILLLCIASYLFIYGAITSAPFFGVVAMESEKKITSLYYMGTFICIALIPAAYVLSKKLFK